MKKTIWKLLYKFLLAGIPLWGLMAFTYFFPMNYMAIEYSMWAEERDYVSTDLEDAKVLIIGDSRAKSGLMPEFLSPSTYNIAVGGTTSIEMYYALKTYLSTHTAPESVIIIYAPYHFCDIDNWGQTLYYNYLSLGQLAEVYKNAAPYKDPVIFADNAFSDTLSYKLRLPSKYLAAEYNAGFIGRKADNLAKYAQVRAARGYTAFGTDPGNDGVNYETHHEVFDQSPLVEAYYYKLLDLCKENQIQIIIEQSPINQASYDVLSPDFTKGYQSFMGRVSAAYPEAVVNDAIYPYDNKYFGDNNHLNPSGAKVFTQEIRDKYSDLFTP